MKSKFKEFRKSNLGLSLVAIVSICAGLGLLITPENTSYWIIRGIGVLWIIEGFGYIGNIITRNLNEKLEKLTDDENN